MRWMFSRSDDLDDDSWIAIRTVKDTTRVTETAPATMYPSRLATDDLDLEIIFMGLFHSHRRRTSPALSLPTLTTERFPVPSTMPIETA